MNPPPLPPVPNPGDVVGRFTVVKELGRGGMAAVLEVEDSESGVHRALKVMLPNRTTPDFRERFRREFKTLGRLSHPNVLKVFETGVWGEQPYYVMEYLAGHELKEVVETWKELPPQERFRRAERVLVQVARALEHIHRRGLVHRDVTPSNILVLEDGTIRLMDFGVVRDPGMDLTVDGEMVGTVAYMAPEQIMSARVDPRADLYSLGAVLYLMLTGRRPFNSRTIAGYLDKHLNHDVKPPRTIHPTLPEKLDRICTLLLKKDPEDRIASATHLLRLLESDGAPARPAATGANGDVPLVGRARELSQIREIVGRLLGGRGGVIVIEGGAGFGKARMAAELQAQATRAGLVVYRASNQAPDQRVFEGYRPLYKELVKAAKETSPVLEAAFGTGTTGVGADRRVVFEEFRKLCASVGTRLLVLDNLDLADRATVDLTEYLARNLLGVDRAPVVLAFTRELSDDLRVDPLAPIVEGTTTGVPAVRITLGPISVSAVEELLLSFVQDDPRLQELAKRLHEEGAGNPYLINQMVESLFDEGILVPGGDEELGRLAPGAFEGDAVRDALPVPRTIRDLWRSRIAPLSDDAKGVLLTFAASRGPLDLDLLSGGSGLGTEHVHPGLDELLERGLAHAVGGGEDEHYDLSLARLRDVVVEDAEPEQMALIHQRLGAMLERRSRHNPGPVLEILAFHFERGNVPAKAYRYLHLSAERHLSRGYRKEALDLLDRALAIEHGARFNLTLEEADRLLAEVLLLKARALFHLGHWNEAEETAEKARAHGNELGYAWLLSKTLNTLAEISRFTKSIEVSEALAREALQKARESRDPALEIEPLFHLGVTTWSLGSLDEARQFWLDGLTKAESQGAETIAARGYAGLGLVAICRGHIVEARKYLEQAFESCDRLGLVESLATSGCNLVELYHFSGNLRKGVDLADRVVARTREVSYPFGIALGLRYRALMMVDLGRLAEAEETAREALRMLEELGDERSQFETLVVLVRVALANERFDDARRWLDQALPLGERFDDEGFLPVLLAWHARLLVQQGQFEQARSALARAHLGADDAWPHQRVRILLNVARVHELLHEADNAREQAEAALRLSDSHGFRYYAMRARQVLARVSQDEAQVARNARVAEALARSLAANLPEDEAKTFLALQGVTG